MKGVTWFRQTFNPFKVPGSLWLALLWKSDGLLEFENRNGRSLWYPASWGPWCQVLFLTLVLLCFGRWFPFYSLLPFFLTHGAEHWFWGGFYAWLLLLSITPYGPCPLLPPLPKLIFLASPSNRYCLHFSHFIKPYLYIYFVLST